MKTALAYTLAFLIFLTTASARAETIPPHLAAMAAQLYKGTQADLKSKKFLPERRKILEESVKTLRAMGIHRWSTKPAKISGAMPEVAEKLNLDPNNAQDRKLLGEFMSWRANTGTEEALLAFEKIVNRPISQDERNKKAAEVDSVIGAAQEKLENTYASVPNGGRTVQMKWKPDAGRFLIKVLDDGSGGSEEFATAFVGDVTVEISENGKDMALHVKPSDKPLHAITHADFESMRGNIFGEWKDKETGEVYQFSASDEKIGEILPPKEVFNDQIDQIKDKIKSIKESVIFKWKNLKTGEIVRQEKYRRLKEPFDYIGEEYVLDNAKEQIAKLEGKIAALEKERDGGSLLPKDKHDPAGFNGTSQSKGVGAITVHVVRPDGYAYDYDEAVFDGRQIAAKRTYKDVRDIENLKLPERIRNQAIDNGWNPPGWLELEASIDAETGDMILEGSKWGLHVTYSSFMGDPPDIDSIHTPFPSSRALNKGGVDFEAAEGAASDFVP